MVSICTSTVLYVSQDFEALTPNLLARTIETVEGGGIVVILLRTMNSLKQLYTMTMVSPEPSPPHSQQCLDDHGDLFPSRMFTPDTGLRLIRTWLAGSTRGWCFFGFFLEDIWSNEWRCTGFKFFNGSP